MPHRLGTVLFFDQDNLVTMSRALSPSAVADQLGVSPDVVRALIHSGQLAAINVAIDPQGRPRWKIDQDEVDRFKKRRGSAPAPTSESRRPRVNGVTRYYN